MTQIVPDQVWPKINGNFDDEKKGPWSACEGFFKYDTSTAKASRYSLAPNLLFERTNPELCPVLTTDDQKMNTLNYQTTYGDSFTLQFNNEDIINRADHVPFRNFHFMQNAQDRFKFAPGGRKEHISETKDKYTSICNGEPPGLLVNRYPSTHCEIKSFGKEALSKAPIEIDSMGRHLDIYISQSQMDYIYKDPLAVEKLNKMPENYRASMYPNPPTATQRKQADCYIFQPYVQCGPMQSETKASFTKRLPPADPLLESDILQFKLTIGAAHAAPNMYHTEYSHLGRPWFTDIAVTHSN